METIATGSGRLRAIGAPAFLFAYVTAMAFLFAQVEVQIEGPHGWAASLPTWRVEGGNGLIDFFWGGRPVTGYHVWVFAFMFVSFHLVHALNGRFCLRTEARLYACLMYFWTAEDFLWFAINPAYGLGVFHPGGVPWHKHWLLGMPVDYWIWLPAAAALFALSYATLPAARRRRHS